MRRPTPRARTPPRPAGGQPGGGGSRKPPALLAQRLIAPSAMALAGAIWLAFSLLQGGGLSVALASLLLVLGAALFVWQWADWRNDYYLVTDRRVVWLEKVIGIYDSRQESPLGMILSVSLASNLSSRVLGFADVVIRSYTGSIVSRHAAHASTIAALIEDLRRRHQAQGEQADRQVLTTALRERLQGESTAPTAPARPSEAARIKAGSTRLWGTRAPRLREGITPLI